MVGLPSMAQKSHFLALVWTHFERLVREAIVPNSAKLLNMHVCASVECMYIAYLLIFEPIAKC